MDTAVSATVDFWGALTKKMENERGRGDQAYAPLLCTTGIRSRLVSTAKGNGDLVSNEHNPNVI